MMKIHGLESLIAKLNSMGGKVQEALNNAVLRVTADAGASARANYVPSASSQGGSEGSGGGRTAIHELSEMEGNMLIGKVVTNSPHAAYVEFGTGPEGAADHGGISPNVPVTWSPGPWYYQSGPKEGDLIPGGGWIYPVGEDEFRWTRGCAARPFMYPAATDNRDNMRLYAEQELLQAIARMAR